MLHPHRRGPGRPHGRDRHRRHPRGGHAQVAEPDRAGRPAHQLVQHGRLARRELRVRVDGRQQPRRQGAGRRRRLPSRRGTTRCTRSRPRSPTPSAAGCTVVLKPSEVAPLDAFILAEVIDDAGLPAGVFNLVTGTGPEVGEAIAAHPGIDMVSFTGSTRAGKRVAEVASQTAQAGRPRARRQVGQHPARRPRRRRLRAGRARRHRQGLPQLGPDLHRPHPHARARPTGWPTPSASRPTRSRPSSSPRTPSPTAPMLGPLSSAGPGRAGHRLHPEGHRRGRQARHRRPRASPRARTSRAATSCSRPSSPTCATT